MKENMDWGLTHEERCLDQESVCFCGWREKYKTKQKKKMDNKIESTSSQILYFISMTT